MKRDRPGRRVGSWIASAGFLAIAIATLTPVASAGGGTSRICLICHSRGMADFLSNIVLFAPLGFGLALRGWSLRRTAFAGMVFSLTIELLQLQVISGRDSNFGDVVANSMGGVAGWLAWRSLPWWQPRPNHAMTRAVTLALIALGILIGGLSLLVPAPQPTTYFIQWTADLGGLEHYGGRVLKSKLDGLDLEGATRVQPSDTVRRLLLQPRWTVHFIAGAAPPSLAPIVSIYDEFRQEVMLLGAREGDVEYRQRLRAGMLRFDEPDLRVYGALHDVVPGDNVTLRWIADRERVCVSVNERMRCSHGYTVGDTWALLLFPDSWGRTARIAMCMAWLFGIFLPVGFVAYRWMELLVITAGTLVVLIGTPALIGFAMTPLWQVLMAILGLMNGHIAARLIRRREQSVAAHNV